MGPPPPDEAPLDDGALYCANHPNRETVLRCNRCSKPICTSCAVQTPVGYRCRECVGQQQAVYFTGGAVDYVIGGAIALVLGGVASYLMTLLGAWFIALILGPAVGIGIAELVRLAVRRRRRIRQIRKPATTSSAVARTTAATAPAPSPSDINETLGNPGSG